MTDRSKFLIPTLNFAYFYAQYANVPFVWLPCSDRLQVAEHIESIAQVHTQLTLIRFFSSKKVHEIEWLLLKTVSRGFFSHFFRQAPHGHVGTITRPPFIHHPQLQDSLPNQPFHIK